MGTGNPWVFLGVPVPIPAKTPTRGNGPAHKGKGFSRVAEIVPAPAPVWSQTRTPTASPWTTAHTAITTPPSPNTQLHTLAPQSTSGGFRRRSVKKDASNEQLRFCVKILDQMGRKQHATVVGPFAEPVDWVKLGIPDYPKIVKKPTDLSTMRSKLESGAYHTAEKFRDDFKLIISNCNLYNPPGTLVHQAGVELKKLFEEKWKGLPPLRAESEDDEGDDDSETDEERSRALTIATM
ncbi:Bromodomain-containing protein [Russula aff. rugulosa BPL654]|nr:Bromodomain-containing protein [Russula aff. rugulosa BPL654]